MSARRRSNIRHLKRMRSVNNSKIAKIYFRFGMIENMKEKFSCGEHILAGDGILPDIQRIFDTDKIAELSGKYGNPDWGSPIQYHWARVETEDGKSYEFEACNLAIMMFHSEDEKIKRLFRFLVRVERYISSHE